MGPTTAILKSYKYMGSPDNIMKEAKNGNTDAMLRMGMEYVHIIIDIEREKKITSRVKEYDVTAPDVGILMAHAIYWLEHALSSNDKNIKRQAYYWLGECMLYYIDQARGLGTYIMQFFDYMKLNDPFIGTIKEESTSFTYNFVFGEEFAYTAMLKFYQEAAALGDTSACYRLGSHYLSEWKKEPDEQYNFKEAKKFLSKAIRPREEYALMDLFDALENASFRGRLS